MVIWGMMPQPDSQSQIVGRKEELKELQGYLDKAAKGKGYTILISGEAGVGKTRLVNELKDVAQSKGFQILSGNSMYESLTPYMPFMEALRSGGLDYLFAEEAPKVDAVYLVSNNGLLIKEVLRKSTELDSDIFTSMLATVSDFVRESLSMLDSALKEGVLNTLGYQNYRILIESGEHANLVVIITGRENEFLVNDMKEILANINKRYKDVLEKWDGREESVIGIERNLEFLITSGKYDGIYYGKDNPRTRRNLLFENVSLGLMRQAKTTPTLLCLEDLQWADHSSLALMHYVARNTRNCKLMVLGTYRPEEVTVREEEGTHYLLETLHLMSRENLLNKLELGRLSEDETIELLSMMLGETDLPDSFKEQLHRDAEGNPLFMIEVINLLMAEKLIMKENGKWKLGTKGKRIKIPSKVCDVVMRRLDRLSAKQRKILEYASIVGDEFTPELLSNVMKTDKIELLEQLRDMEKYHRLVEFSEDRCKFDHAKTKEVLYTEIPRMLRTEYHSIVANQLEKINKDDLTKIAEDLAYHYYRAKDLDKGIEYLTMAAENARNNYAIKEAVEFYNEGLDLIDEKGSEDMKLEILSKLGELYMLSGELENCLNCYNQLLNLSQKYKNEPKKIIAFHNIGLVHKRRNEWDEAIKNLEKSLIISTQLSDLHSEAENYYDLGYVYERKGDYNNAVKCFGKALYAAVNANDNIVIAGIYRAFGSISDLKGDHEDAINQFEKSLKIFEKTGNLIEIARVYNDLGISCFLKGDLDKAIEHNEKSIEISKKIGDIRGLGYALLSAAEAYTKKRGFDKAVELLENASEIFEKLNEKMMIAAVYRNYGIVNRMRSEWNESSAAFDKAIDIYENQVSAPYYQAYTHYNYGLMFKEKGDVSEARIHFEKARAIYDKLDMEKESEKVEKELEGL